MMRRTACFLLAAALGVAVYAAWSSPARTDDKADKPAAPYVHTVIFYLKPDAPSTAAEGLIADAHGMLRAIPTVRYLSTLMNELINSEYGETQ